MANDTGGIFQTLVAAADMAQQELRFRNAFIDAIYWDTKPEPVQPFTGLNVIIPTVNEGDVSDIGSGPLQPADTNHNNVQIPFNMHFSTSFIIKVWDLVRTPVHLKQKYIQPKLEAMMRKVNRTISQQVTTANFSNYSIISGATTSELARPDIASAWNNLAAAGCPVEDDGNMFLIESPLSFSKQIGDASFINQAIVSDGPAMEAQQRAKLRLMYGSEVRWDQHIAQFNANKEPGIFMHRYAISGVTAPLISMNDPSIHESTGMLKNVLPYQMQAQPSLKDQGWIIHIHCWWGIKVVRPELGSLLQSA